LVFLYLSNGFAWAQAFGETDPFRIALSDEALYLKPDEKVRDRLWLMWSAWLVVDIRTTTPVTLVGEYSLTPLGQWTMERTNRFSLGENPRRPDERIRPGINTLYREFPLAFLDLSPDLLAGSSKASLTSLFQHNQTVKIKLSIKPPYCPGCLPIKERNYDLKPFVYALLSAAGSGNVGVVKELLDKGTDPDSATALNWTALMEAASQGRSRVVKVLLDRGARVNMIRRGFPFVVTQLGSVTPAGETALMAACSAGHSETARLLLDAGAGFTMDRKDGWTALRAASYSGHAEIVRMLIAKGARVDFQPERGDYSALALADINGNAAVYRILKAHGDRIRVPWDVLSQKR